MPSMTRLARVARLARLATLPETRRLIVAAAHSATLREAGRRAVSDRAALVRDLRNPATTRGLVRHAASHPAARELVSAGLMFLPGRYLPLGWAAGWAARKVFRRYIDPPVEVVDAATLAPRPPKNVTTGSS